MTSPTYFTMVDSLRGPFSKVDSGESREINKVMEFSGQAHVELFEADPPGNEDDFLAEHWISESEAGEGQKARRMRGGDASYYLWYTVE